MKLKETMVNYLKKKLGEEYTLKFDVHFEDEGRITLRIYQEENHEAMISLVVNKKVKEIYITNILFNSYYINHKGIGKELIEVIYKKGKKEGYRTFLVDMVESFFNRMVYRGATPINDETVEINDETDFSKSNRKYQSFSNELKNIKGIKEEFLPLVEEDDNEESYSTLDFLGFYDAKEKRIDFLLKNLENNELYKEMEKEEKILIFKINAQYILDTYFDKNDPVSCDPELCKYFCFEIGEDSIYIDILKNVKAKYVVTDYLSKNEIITGIATKMPFFINKNDLKNYLINNMPLYLSNILYYAKKKGKLGMFPMKYIPKQHGLFIVKQ